MIDNEEFTVVARRSMKDRIGWGVFAAFWFVMVCGFTYSCFVFGFKNPIEAIMYIAGLAISWMGEALFLMLAGPSDLSCDVCQDRYAIRRGFPIFSWTVRGPLAGSELYIYFTKSEEFQIRFMGYGTSIPVVVGSFDSEEEARNEAWRIATTLGVALRRRDAPPLAVIKTVKKTKR